MLILIHHCVPGQAEGPPAAPPGVGDKDGRSPTSSGSRRGSQRPGDSPTRRADSVRFEEAAAGILAADRAARRGRMDGPQPPPPFVWANAKKRNVCREDKWETCTYIPFNAVQFF